MFVDTQVRPQGEQVDVIAPSKMKLSAAIRIGAKIRPQCSGRYFKSGASCAMGAAMEAMGIPYSDESSDTPLSAIPKFPELFVEWGEYTELAKRICTKNDDEGWSRERIADWLEAQGL